MTEGSASARPIVCGHRGAPAVVPENTLASFAEAAKRGATWVEFDVRPTGDGRLAIHHDPVTATGAHIGTTPYGELDPAIPQFGDLVAACPELGLDIEMKTDGIDMPLDRFAQLVVDEVDQHCDAGAEFIVTSFDADALRAIRSLRPAMRTGLLFADRNFDEALAMAVADGHQSLAPWIHLLTADMVERTREAGLGVVTWTVNDPQLVMRAASLGVDMIIGDDPAVIVASLHQAEAEN